MGVMDIKDFCCYGCLTDEVIENMGKVDCSIDIICHYYDAREIITNLIFNGCTLGNITLEDEECCGYHDAFVITISKVIDGEYSIWCEPMMREGSSNYIYCEADIAYVFDYCNSKILRSIKSDVVYQVFVNDEDMVDEFKCSGDCANCDLNDDDNIAADYMKPQIKPKTESIKMDDDMKGFTISTSDTYGNSTFYFHSTDVSLVKEMLKKYGKF
jgi:hypothetical protein